jgi:hypothetical protein
MTIRDLFSRYFAVSMQMCIFTYFAELAAALEIVPSDGQRCVLIYYSNTDQSSGEGEVRTRS